jgi:hypothetical protein
LSIDSANLRKDKESAISVNNAISTDPLDFLDGYFQSSDDLLSAIIPEVLFGDLGRGPFVVQFSRPAYATTASYAQAIIGRPSIKWNRLYYKSPHIDCSESAHQKFLNEWKNIHRSVRPYWTNAASSVPLHLIKGLWAWSDWFPVRSPVHFEHTHSVGTC